MEPLVVARIRAREETDSASAPNIHQDGNTITAGETSFCLISGLGTQQMDG
jgi:hypothetical protein